MSILTTISMCVAIIATFFLITSGIGDIFKNTYQIGLVELFMSCILCSLELPNIMCCFTKCSNIQKYTHCNKVIMIKSILYIIFGIILFILINYLKSINGSTILCGLLLILTGALYLFSYYKAGGLHQTLSITEFVPKKSIATVITSVV